MSALKLSCCLLSRASKSFLVSGSASLLLSVAFHPLPAEVVAAVVGRGAEVLEFVVVFFFLALSALILSLHNRNI